MDGLGRRIDIDTTSPIEEKGNPAGRLITGGQVGLGIGGTALGTQLGSRAGYYMGDEYGTGRFVGGAIGGTIGGAVGLSAIPMGKKAIGTAINKAKDVNFREVASGIGSAAKNVAGLGVEGIKNVGNVASNIGKTGLHAISGISGEGTMASAFSPVRQGIGAINKIVDGAFVSPNGINSFKDLKDVRLSGYISGAKKGWNTTSGNKIQKAVGSARGSLMSGQSLLFGAAATKGVVEGVRAVNKINQGTNLQGIYTNTPSVPQYDDNSGATGDLVFALHRLRGGGR